GVYEAEMPQPALSAADMVVFLQETLEKACAANGLTLGELSGVGLGVAGIVDAPRGLVYWSPTLTERNVPLRDLLSTVLPMPVFIDNDANLVAKAEQLFGEGQGVSDFIVVTIEQGVGMGIVIDNRIYRGTRGCGAEFGHTKVQLDGALCRCGQRGCLEAYVADYALLREAGTLNLPDMALNPLNALFQAAKGGDETARSIFHRASRMFALGLANIINIFDPKLIILSGERMQFDYFYAQEVLDAVKSSVLQIDAPLPDIRIHKWGDLMWAKGAAAYAMEGVSDISVREMGKNAG
ncbi:MAG: ROK family protein, partial [Rhodobacteraceae bacterium]|nr:ROK family protein [Paracoccaceae bacterium]